MRRGSWASVGIALALAGSALGVRAQNAAQAPPAGEWGYSGPTGPDHWAEMSKTYAICATGQQESPIDLRDAVSAKLDPLALSWRSMPIGAKKNGHAIEAEAAAGNSIRLGGRDYALAQFHIHHPSEHLIAGRRFPLEIHFVHKGEGGEIVVVGVLVREGTENATLARVLASIDKMPGGTIDPARLLPAARSFYRYEGSLTTPPCSEVVHWIVLDTPITASRSQVQAVEAIYPFNARPLQRLDRRFLLRSR